MAIIEVEHDDLGKEGEPLTGSAAAAPHCCQIVVGHDPAPIGIREGRGGKEGKGDQIKGCDDARFLGSTSSGGLTASNCAARRGGHDFYSMTSAMAGKCAFPCGGSRGGTSEWLGSPRSS